MIDVIIPIYNQKNYLDDCLQSLLNQTYKNFKVHLIDDGSSDGSSLILKAYAAKYPTLFHYHFKENGGLSDARNYGLKFVNAPYIHFLDSDDYLDSQFYEIMLKEIEGYDLVATGMNEFNNNGIFNKIPATNLQDPDTIKAGLFAPMFASNKLYKASLFEDLRYPKGYWYEDIPVFIKLISSNIKINFLDNYLFYYRHHDDSIMKSNNNPKLFDIFTICKMVIAIFKEKNLLNKYYYELEFFIIEHLRLYGMYRFLRSNYKKTLISESNHFMQLNFPNFKKNPYLKKRNLKERLFVKYPFIGRIYFSLRYK